MGLTVDEDDLRLFLVCSDPAQVDMERVKRIHTTNAPRRDKSSDSDAETKAVNPKAKRAQLDSSSEAGEGFAAAMQRVNKSAKGASGKSTKVRGPVRRGDSDSDSLSEEEPAKDDQFAQKEKQRLVSEIRKLVEQHSLPHRVPSLREPLRDITIVHDAVIREASVGPGVEAFLTVVTACAPLLEAVVMSRQSMVNIRGWSTVFVANVDWYRGPVTELWRLYMLRFGPSNPWTNIALLTFGSMAGVAFMNYYQKNPATINLAFNIVCPILGMTKTPAPRTRAGPVPASAPAPAPAPAPAFFPAPPPPQGAGGNRVTMKKPTF